MKSTQYVPTDEFKAFNKNFELVIQTFNHSVTDLKKDIAVIKKENCSQGKKLDEHNQILSELLSTVTEIKTDIKWSNKIIWWVMGIFSAVIVGVVLFVLKGN